MASSPSFGNILMVGDVLLHTDIINEFFCCDLEACQGRCCVEGDAGAPVTPDEIARIEDCLDTVWGDLGAQAQAEIDRRGVSYVDPEGELVTTIINGKDCVFTRQGETPGGKPCTLCALECAFRQGRTHWKKPTSCSLYPIREKKLGSLVGLNYHRWEICQPGVELGRKLRLPLYKFLREPLIHRFGEAWYGELETAVSELEKNQITP